MEMRHFSTSSSLETLIHAFMEDHSNKPEDIALQVPPYLRIYKDGTVERIAGTGVTPPGFDPQTGVISKDLIIVPETGVSARLYRPNAVKPHHKLPLVVYYHGGAFCVASTAEPFYHDFLNLLVAEANVVVVSVNYRLVPEYPLPAAYEDSWSALEWVSVQSQLSESDDGHEPWLKNLVNFQRVFMAGDSAGGNITHHMAMRFRDSDLLKRNIKLNGIALIHPYFWGEEAIGLEITDHERKNLVDIWWKFVCPSERGNDDLFINPFGDGAPAIDGLAGEKILVIVAEKDILKERGKVYYENLKKSEWKGKVELMETEGEDHVFHIFNPTSQKAKTLVKTLAYFTNE